MKRRVTALRMMFVALVLVAVTAQPAAADEYFPFSYRIDATTHLKKLNQAVTVPPGTFIGVIDLTTARLTGSITAPKATINRDVLRHLYDPAAQDLRSPDGCVESRDPGAGGNTFTAKATPA